MKVIIVLVVVVGLAVAGVYFFGGYRTLDPSQQGRDARARIRPGMAWTQVVDIAGPPQEYRHLVMPDGKGALPKPGPLVRFERDDLTKRLKANGAPLGFFFIYRFSNSVAFEVSFDRTGTVKNVGDALTFEDLVNPR